MSYFQAVKDVESLLGAQEIALKYPQKFLQKFNDQMSQLPVNQDIPNIPNIDWDKYKIPSVSHVVQKPETRYKGNFLLFQCYLFPSFMNTDRGRCELRQKTIHKIA